MNKQDELKQQATILQVKLATLADLPSVKAFLDAQKEFNMLATIIQNDEPKEAQPDSN